MRLLKIGRDATCDIVLYSEKVSSLHAEITLMNSGDILLEDKGSQNGTFIQNQAIKPGKPVNVRRGDAIRFADVELQWSQIPMPEDNSAYKAIYGIGSHFNNDIQISGGTVSRYHATIKVGKDNKVYIIDHSKNGTTVDGQKIAPHNPYRIKKSSSVVCGGVPVNLKATPVQWPSELWKTILMAAASVLVLVGIGFGIYKFMSGRSGKQEDTELYAKYNHSVVMLVGIYHYEVSIGDLDLDALNALLPVSARIPTKLLPTKNNYVDVSSYSSKQLIDALDKKGMYGGTGFFISNDGQLITNLHVVKPWLFNGEGERLQQSFARWFTGHVAFLNSALRTTQYNAYLSQVKVTGVLDYVALIPHGEVFDADNINKCRVLSAGEDINKDVALVQTISKRLPTSECTVVNVKDSIDVSDEALKVGEHIYTLGFPLLTSLQDKQSENGIQLLARGGSITQILNEYRFGFDAASFGGASGSPIFNDKGMLIGLLNSGVSATQGFNYGIKAKYIKEMLDSPHVK